MIQVSMRFKLPPRSFLFKIFMGYIVITLFLITVNQLFTFRLVKDFYIQTLTKDLFRLMSSIEPQLSKYLDWDNIDQLQAKTEKLAKHLGVRITIIDTTGKVYVESVKNPKDLGNHMTRPEVLAAQASNYGSSLRYSETTDEESLYVAKRLNYSKADFGTLRVSLYIRQMNTLLNQLIRNISLMVALLTAATLCITFFISKSLSLPLKELRQASIRVGRGDFSTKALVNDNSEFHELAENFNDMTRKIQSLFLDLKEEREELNNIIYSVQEGIMALDANTGHILLANNMIKRWTEDGIIKGKPYWKVINDANLKPYLDTIWKERKSYSFEINIFKRDYLCSASYLPLKKAIVLIFLDISERKLLDKEKRDFISNVSHELRTPLTSIKGFVETIIDQEQDDKKKKWLAIIHRNTERLIAMVSDLLALSKIESKETELQLEAVSPRDIINNVLKLFENKAKANKLALEFINHTEDKKIEADPYMLEQLLINLIDNAIKYSETGMVTAHLRPLKINEKGFIEIIIEDTGIGIPQKHLQHLFKRFYVVDKSRTRESGGTGLGLSIVKHIVLNHSWKIHVESKVREGSKFIITVPLLNDAL